MELKRAIEVAQLWRAGKLLGEDENEVRDALLEEVERLTNWQPIATAPKDGTGIIALFPELGQVVAYYSGDNVNSAGGWSIGQDYYGPAPTLWLPLVETPNFN